MAMSKMARAGLMDRLSRKMGQSREERNSAIADKYGSQFRAGMEGGNPGADVVNQARSDLEQLRGAGQTAIDAGALRQGDAARAMGQRPEPDADDMGGPSDNDADDVIAKPMGRRFTRMRR